MFWDQIQPASPVEKEIIINSLPDGDPAQGWRGAANVDPIKNCLLGDSSGRTAVSES